MNRRQFITSTFGASFSLAATGALAQTSATGIILVGAGWCNVCKQAAPMLEAFSQAHGVPVLVASGDNQPIPPFASVVPAAGHPIAQQVQAYPTTLVFSNKSNQLVASIVGYRNPTWYLSQVRSGVIVSEQM